MSITKSTELTRAEQLLLLRTSTDGESYDRDLQTLIVSVSQELDQQIADNLATEFETLKIVSSFSNSIKRI